MYQEMNESEPLDVSKVRFLRSKSVISRLAVNQVHQDDLRTGWTASGIEAAGPDTGLLYGTWEPVVSM